MARQGKIQTVLGLVEPCDIGITFPHEHLSMEFSVAYTPSKDTSKDHCTFQLDTLGWIRQNPYSHWPNLTLLDAGRVITEELVTFKANGGSCIVENSTVGLNRNISYVQQVSKDTGIHVVAGAGFYVDASRPETRELTVEELTKRIIQEVDTGVDGTDIKCGVIGEIGCSWPLTESERRVLQAVANAQTELGCGVIIHPGRDPTAPFEITRILQEAGGNIQKTVMSHLDRAGTICDYGALVEFAGLGAYCEYDLFGIEVSHYQLSPTVDMPNDAERIRRIRHLMDNGYGDKVLISHDIHSKQRLVKYGGHGFSHILENIVPMMITRGFLQSDIDKILIDNPRTWMTFTK